MALLNEILKAVNEFMEDSLNSANAFFDSYDTYNTERCLGQREAYLKVIKLIKYKIKSNQLDEK